MLLALLALFALPFLLLIGAALLMVLWREVTTSPAVLFGLAAGVVTFVWMQIAIWWQTRRERKTHT